MNVPPTNLIDPPGQAAPLSAAKTVEGNPHSSERLSPWWRRSAAITMVLGFAVLILLTVRVYTDAPPIARQVVTDGGTVVYTGKDVSDGQQVFLKYALMDNGSIWGHGALLGPDFSAAYLHSLTTDLAQALATERYKQPLANLSAAQLAGLQAEVRIELKRNRYDAQTQVLTVSAAHAQWFERQSATWVEYFSNPVKNGGLTRKAISDPTQLRQLSAFVAWTAKASVTNRPGEAHSYTNNFPYDPVAGNTPSSGALLWSAISLIFLLVGTALVLLAFGKWDYLGWKAKPGYLHPKILGGSVTPAQRATLKYFVVVALLLLAQTFVGSAVAHYRADPGDFYGIDLALWLPSNLLRTWHLQLALF